MNFLIYSFVAISKLSAVKHGRLFGAKHWLHRIYNEKQKKNVSSSTNCICLNLLSLFNCSSFLFKDLFICFPFCFCFFGVFCFCFCTVVFFPYLFDYIHFSLLYSIYFFFFLFFLFGFIHFIIN